MDFAVDVRFGLGPDSVMMMSRAHIVHSQW